MESKDGESETLRDVRGVRFELHPTFEPAEYYLSKPPFTVGPFVGWGTFDVKVHVEVEDLPMISTSFPLSFDRAEKVVQLPAAAA